MPTSAGLLLSSSLFKPAKGSPFAEEFPGVCRQRKPPCQYLKVSRRCAELRLIPGPRSCTPTSLARVSPPCLDGRGCADSLLFAAWVWLRFGGELFHSRFPRYALTPVIVHSPFIAVEGRFFHFSIWSHQKQITLWEVAGGVTHPQRSPCFAERGHYCLTFLLEFSIPTEMSSAACQSRLPSLSPLCHHCFCSLLCSS